MKYKSYFNFLVKTWSKQEIQRKNCPWKPKNQIYIKTAEERRARKRKIVTEEIIALEPRFPRRLTRRLTVKDAPGRKGHERVKPIDCQGGSVCSQDSEGLTGFWAHLSLWDMDAFWGCLRTKPDNTWFPLILTYHAERWGAWRAAVHTIKKLRETWT